MKRIECVNFISIYRIIFHSNQFYACQIIHSIVVTFLAAINIVPLLHFFLFQLRGLM